jgi:hypothetical protein
MFSRDPYPVSFRNQGDPLDLRLHFPAPYLEELFLKKEVRMPWEVWYQEENSYYALQSKWKLFETYSEAKEFKDSLDPDQRGEIRPIHHSKQKIEMQIKKSKLKISQYLTYIEEEKEDIEKWEKLLLE